MNVVEHANTDTVLVNSSCTEMSTSDSVKTPSRENVLLYVCFLYFSPFLESQVMAYLFPINYLKISEGF